MIDRNIQERHVAEIVGPAGAGKSTLARLLRERDRTIQTGASVWGLPLSLLVLNLFPSLRAVPRLSLSHWLNRDELELIIRMNALDVLVSRQPSNGSKTLLMDEGIVFALGKLWTLDEESSGKRELSGWMRGVLAHWAPKLGSVIWLDAPDDVLIERLRSRPKPHRVKRAPEREIQEFMARYRRAYEHIVSALMAHTNLKVIRFDTSLETPGRIADRVLVEISSKREAHVVC